MYLRSGKIQALATLSLNNFVLILSHNIVRWVITEVMAAVTRAVLLEVWGYQH